MAVGALTPLVCLTLLGWSLFTLAVVFIKEDGNIKNHTPGSDMMFILGVIGAVVSVCVVIAWAVSHLDWE